MNDSARTTARVEVDHRATARSHRRDASRTRPHQVGPRDLDPDRERPRPIALHNAAGNRAVDRLLDGQQVRPAGHPVQRQDEGPRDQLPPAVAATTESRDEHPARFEQASRTSLFGSLERRLTSEATGFMVPRTREEMFPRHRKPTADEGYVKTREVSAPP